MLSTTPCCKSFFLLFLIFISSSTTFLYISTQSLSLNWDHVGHQNKRFWGGSGIAFLSKTGIRLAQAIDFRTWAFAASSSAILFVVFAQNLAMWGFQSMSATYILKYISATFVGSDSPDTTFCRSSINMLPLYLYLNLLKPIKETIKEKNPLIMSGNFSLSA